MSDNFYLISCLFDCFDASKYCARILPVCCRHLYNVLYSAGGGRQDAERLLEGALIPRVLYTTAVIRGCMPECVRTGANNLALKTSIHSSDKSRATQCIRRVPKAHRWPMPTRPWEHRRRGKRASSSSMRRAWKKSAAAQATSLTLRYPPSRWMLWMRLTFRDGWL